MWKRKLLLTSQIWTIISVISTFDLVENSFLRHIQYIKFLQTTAFNIKITFRGKQPIPSSGKVP